MSANALGEKAACGGQEDSIRGSQVGPSDLATEHRELMAKHDDLQVLELARAEAQRGQLQATTKHEVAQ